METIIKKATSQGYALNKDEMNFALTTRMVCDSSFWQALGKACGWGEWTISFKDFPHEWELDHYLPDTGKTPVYYCKKACGARKTSNVIMWDNGEDGGEEYETIPRRHYHFSSHGSYKKDNWKTNALRFHEINLTEEWDKAVLWLTNLIN